MPLLYDEIFIKPQGIMTLREFTAPRDGRTVKFCMPNGYIQKKVYICIDDQYSGPFTKAAPLASNIRGLEFLRAGCHSAAAIVIDTSARDLAPMPLNMNPIDVTLSSGEKAAVKISGMLYASIRVKNSDALIADFKNKGITSPESRAQSVLLECFEEEIEQQIPERIRAHDVLTGLGGLDELKKDIRNAALVSAGQHLEYPWLEIVSCRLELNSPNLEEIIEKENYLWHKKEEEGERIKELQERMIEKTHDALLAAYGRSPIPDKMVELAAAYIQNNPMAGSDEMLKICREFKSLSQTYGPELVYKEGIRMLENKNAGRVK